MVSETRISSSHRMRKVILWSDMKPTAQLRINRMQCGVVLKFLCRSNWECKEGPTSPVRVCIVPVTEKALTHSRHLKVSTMLLGPWKGVVRFIPSKG